MKTSYNEATAMGCSSLEKDLVLCEDAGFDYIEIRGDMLLDYLSTHRLDDLAAFFAGSRIRPHAINALYTYNHMFHPRHADKEHDRALLAYFLVCCQAAQRIGSHHFIVVPHILGVAGGAYLPKSPNTGPYPDSQEKVTEDSVRILRQLADIAAAYGINLCLEPVGSENCAVRTVTHAWEIIRETARENVGITLDPFNLYLHGGLNDFSEIRQVPLEKIFAVHVNNCDILPPGSQERPSRLFAGPGAIDLDNYMGTLQQMGYTGMVSIETFRAEYWQWDAERVIREAYRTTKELLDRYPT